jgi:hypothetical protein
MCFCILEKNELYVRNDVSNANKKVGKNRLLIRTGLSKVQMSSNVTCIGKHGVAISIMDMGRAVVAKEMTLVIQQATCNVQVRQGQKTCTHAEHDGVMTHTTCQSHSSAQGCVRAGQRR